MAVLTLHKAGSGANTALRPLGRTSIRPSAPVAGKAEERYRLWGVWGVLAVLNVMEGGGQVAVVLLGVECK